VEYLCIGNIVHVPDLLIVAPKVIRILLHLLNDDQPAVRSLPCTVHYLLIIAIHPDQDYLLVAEAHPNLTRVDARVPAVLERLKIHGELTYLVHALFLELNHDELLRVGQLLEQEVLFDGNLRILYHLLPVLGMVLRHYVVEAAEVRRPPLILIIVPIGAVHTYRIIVPEGVEVFLFE
jgi:hypothetical protein